MLTEPDRAWKQPDLAVSAQVPSSQVSRTLRAARERGEIIREGRTFTIVRVPTAGRPVIIKPGEGVKQGSV